MPTYLELAYDANYVGKFASIEVWELNGQFYGYGSITGGGPVRIPNHVLQDMFR